MFSTILHFLTKHASFDTKHDKYLSTPHYSDLKCCIVEGEQLVNKLHNTNVSSVIRVLVVSLVP
jgi:hypothetical protein